MPPQSLSSNSAIGLPRKLLGQLSPWLRVPCSVLVQTSQPPIDEFAQMLELLFSSHPDATIVSLDGRSAYDSVNRAAIMGKLKEVAP